MSSWVINSAPSLQAFLGDVRELFDRHKFMKVSIRVGRDRTLDQNALSHCWYDQLARELREFSPSGWKSFCKLHFGVPILRDEDEQFREFYEIAIKNLTYEQAMQAMSFVPITSLMTRSQLSRYLEEVQSHFLMRGVRLEFPE